MGGLAFLTDSPSYPRDDHVFEYKARPIDCKESPASPLSVQDGHGERVVPVAVDLGEGGPPLHQEGGRLLVAVLGGQHQGRVLALVHGVHRAVGLGSQFIRVLAWEKIVSPKEGFLCSSTTGILLRS